MVSVGTDSQSHLILEIKYLSFWDDSACILLKTEGEMLILSYIFSSPRHLSKRSKELEDCQNCWISFCKVHYSTLIWVMQSLFFLLCLQNLLKIYVFSLPLIFNSAAITSQMDSTKTLTTGLHTSTRANLLSFPHSSSYLELCHFHA